MEASAMTYQSEYAFRRSYSWFAAIRSLSVLKATSGSGQISNETDGKGLGKVRSAFSNFFIFLLKLMTPSVSASPFGFVGLRK
jgi:hypothetical protein